MLSGVDVVVIGAGQAGLAVSRCLVGRGIEHLVLERDQVAQAWRDRWDSFTLVTPNWTLDLPGRPYAGDDPEGHVPGSEIVAYLQAYADGLPIREGVAVNALHVGADGGFTVDTTTGPLAARIVVVCTGAFQHPHRPSAALGFPPGVVVMDATQYRNPASLPEGRVLVIGSGQTGVQLTEELHLAGREVFLSCGRAPWAPRRLDGTDVVTWLTRTDFLDQRLADLPASALRLVANIQSTGARGGYDLHFRTLQDLGVPLLGRLAGVADHRASFADDLGASVAFGDARWADICTLLTNQLPARGYPVPEMPVPAPFQYEPILGLDLRDFSTVLLTSGFRPDYRWIKASVCDEMGFPRTYDGACTVAKGLYFCGVHFMRKRRSSLLFGVGEDAEIVATSIADHLAARTS